MDKIRLLVLRITERCNMKCAYCYAAKDNEPQFDMDFDTAKRAIELCCPIGGNLRIQFTGGEPILRLDLMEKVYAFGRETGRKLSLSVQTNATLLTVENCRRLKNMLCAVGVSLDGVGCANSLRVFHDGTPSFDAAAAGIRNLGTVGIRCGVTTVVTSKNDAYLGLLPDMALYFGNVTGIGLDLFRPIGRGSRNDLAPDKNRLENGLSALKARTELLNASGIKFRFREVERIRKRQSQDNCGDIYCYAQTNESLCVDGRGDMWPCSSLVGDRRFFLGNIYDGEPNRTNEQFELLAATAECKECSNYSACLGGCPAARIGLNNKSELNCVMQRVLSATPQKE